MHFVAPLEKNGQQQEKIDMLAREEAALVGCLFASCVRASRVRNRMARSLMAEICDRVLAGAPP